MTGTETGHRQDVPVPLKSPVNGGRGPAVVGAGGGVLDRRRTACAAGYPTVKCRYFSALAAEGLRVCKSWRAATSTVWPVIARMPRAAALAADSVVMHGTL
jgi:hypothetical protein